MFKIGEFSKLVRVSPRMLRHYEKCGLFYPAAIDKLTGYRYYRAGQIPLLTNIVALRDMGFSIEEIGDILPRFEDQAYMNRVLLTQMAVVKQTIKAEEDKLALLNHMSSTIREELDIMVYEVELKALAAVKVLSLRGVIPTYRDEYMLWEKLGAYVGEHRIEIAEGGYSTFFDEEYKELDPDIEIALPVKALGESEGEFVYQEYPAIALAATLRFMGPFDGGYDAACKKLADWMEAEGYAFDGLLRGHVIVSQGEESEPNKWVTELQAPVKRNNE